MSHTKFPTRFGKYILLDRINSGGMAEVYRAKVTGVEEFQRLVAIKCMLPQLAEDRQFTTMFVDEAKLAAQLAHANIVQIYELGRLNERLYIAMELVNGRDLRHVIRVAKQAGMRLPMGFAAYVISKAAEGLDAAHRKLGVDGRPLNLVHRDVSPQNILVSYDGEVKVVDFGIAKAEERATETRAGVLKGKFAYMAPEQVMGEQLDRRADIFALGAVLYEVLTGTKLFRGESDLSILDKVKNAILPELSEALPDAPPEFRETLKRALAKERDQRFAWASELAEALSPMLIQERSIFGARLAKELMHQLYADEIKTLGEQMRRYTAVSDADCVENTGERLQPKSTEVFESTFAAQLATVPNGPRAAAAAAPQDRLDAPSRTQETDAFDAGTGAEEAPVQSTLLYEPQGKPPVDFSATTELLNPSEVLRAAAASINEAPVAGQPAVPKAVLYAMFAAVAALLVVVVVLGLNAGSERSAAPVVITELPSAPAVPAQAVPATPDVPATPAPAPAAPTPAPDDAVTSSNPDEAEGESKKKKAAAFGYLTIKAEGASVAKIFVDGKDVGYSPRVALKLAVGKHKVRVVEEVGGKAARSGNTTVLLTARHTRLSPMKLLLPLE